MESSGIPVEAPRESPTARWLVVARRVAARLSKYMPALKLVGFVAAIGIVVYMATRAAGSVSLSDLTLWLLPIAFLFACGWWLGLARGWSLLVSGHTTRSDVSIWCRTQTLRYLPGGIWAPASRTAVVHGTMLDRLSTVGAENVIALCAALTLGGLALTIGQAIWWAPLMVAIVVPALGSNLLAGRTRLVPERVNRATVNYVVAFLGYAVASVIVQAAVSGLHHPLEVAGAACVAWAVGLVVVFAPGGVGVRELVYVGLLSGAFSSGDLAAAAVTSRLVMIAAELAVLVVAGRPQIDSVKVRAAVGTGVAFLRRHAVFGGLLAAGTVLRVITALAYKPVLIYWDSVGYLIQSGHLRPAETRPLGYPGFLRAVSEVSHSLAAIAITQHLMGLGMGVLIYALLIRLGAKRWLAALAAAPVLLDAYELHLEQMVMTETLFATLILAGCAALLWRRRPTVAWAALAGLLFAGVSLTRANGPVVVLPALLALFAMWWTPAAVAPGAAGRWARIRARVRRWTRSLRPGLVPAVALVVAFAVPLGAYGAWFHHVHGQYALTNWGSRFLYARVAPFADCTKFHVPADKRKLCPAQPVGHRPKLHGSVSNWFMWARFPGNTSPMWKLSQKDRLDLPGDFAKLVIRHQFITYMKTVGEEFIRPFAPIRTRGHGELPISRWQFQRDYPIYARATPQIVAKHGDGVARADRSLTGFLRGYQRFGFLPGPFLALGLLAGLLAALGLGAARRSGLRSASFMFAGTGFIVLLSTVATNEFTWRYVIPLLVLFPPALALGLAALVPRLRLARETAPAEPVPPAPEEPVDARKEGENERIPVAEPSSG